MIKTVLESIKNKGKIELRKSTLMRMGFDEFVGRNAKQSFTGPDKLPWRLKEILPAWRDVADFHSKYKSDVAEYFLTDEGYEFAKRLSERYVGFDRLCREKGIGKGSTSPIFSMERFFFDTLSILHKNRTDKTLAEMFKIADAISNGIIEFFATEESLDWYRMATSKPWFDLCILRFIDFPSDKLKLAVKNFYEVSNVFGGYGEKPERFGLITKHQHILCAVGNLLLQEDAVKIAEQILSTYKRNNLNEKRSVEGYVEFDADFSNLIYALYKGDLENFNPRLLESFLGLVFGEKQRCNIQIVNTLLQEGPVRGEYENSDDKLTFLKRIIVNFSPKTPLRKWTDIVAYTNILKRLPEIFGKLIYNSREYNAWEEISLEFLDRVKELEDWESIDKFLFSHWGATAFFGITNKENVYIKIRFFEKYKDDLPALQFFLDFGYKFESWEQSEALMTKYLKYVASSKENKEYYWKWKDKVVNKNSKDTLRQVFDFCPNLFLTCIKKLNQAHRTGIQIPSAFYSFFKKIDKMSAEELSHYFKIFGQSMRGIMGQGKFERLLARLQLATKNKVHFDTLKKEVAGIFAKATLEYFTKVLHREFRQKIKLEFSGVKNVDNLIDDEYFLRAFEMYERLKDDSRKTLLASNTKLFLSKYLEDRSKSYGLFKPNTDWLTRNIKPELLEDFLGPNKQDILLSGEYKSNKQDRVRNFRKEIFNIATRMGVETNPKMTEAEIFELQEVLQKDKKYEKLWKTNDWKDFITQIEALKVVLEEKEESVAVGNKIVIERETDPVKILSMGSVVNGSCLSADGINYWSSFVNAMEINKCVFWLKNPDGTIVGRVLVAIDRHKKIVRHPIYYRGQSQDLNKQVNEYLGKFAEKYGFEINGDVTTVERLVSNEWYQDPVVRIN